MVSRRDIPRGMLGNNRKACKSLAVGSWFTSFSRVLPTSRVGCHAAKPIESVVYYHKVMSKPMTFFFTKWYVEKKLRGSNTCPSENASLIRAPVPVPICVVDIVVVTFMAAKKRDKYRIMFVLRDILKNNDRGCYLFWEGRGARVLPNLMHRYKGNVN